VDLDWKDDKGSNSLQKMAEITSGVLQQVWDNHHGTVAWLDALEKSMRGRLWGLML